MNIGISTACYYPTETEVSLEFVGKSGAKTAELFFNAMCELKPAFIDMLCDIRDSYGINIHSVHPSFSLTESFVYFSNYDRRFRDGLDTYRRYAQAAEALGAKYLILHGGKPNGILDDEQYCERYMQMNDAVSQYGVRILQENVALHRAADPEFLTAMKDILGDDAQFCIDIKQCIRSGCNPYDLITALGSNIKHFHISDHSLAGDCLLPGKGGFDFNELFRTMDKIGYDGAYMIEVYHSAYHDLTEVADSYQKLISKNGFRVE